MDHGDVFSFDWSFLGAIVWGLVIWASFVGWGYALGNRFFFNEKQNIFGWGMAGAIGMAAYLILSGPLLAISSFSPLFIAVFVGAGFIFLILSPRFFHLSIQTWEEISRARLRMGFMGLLFFIALIFVGATAMNHYNQNDDLPAYFALIKMLLDTGTLFDPFSFRLLGALGGQTALEASMAAFFPWKYVNLLDMGVATLIVFGLAQETVRGSERKAWIARLLLISFAMMFPMPYNNTASQQTGTVFFLALFHAFEWSAARRITGWGAALLLGSIMAGAATLRAPNIFIMMLLGGCFSVWSVWEGRQEWTKVVREALRTLSVVLFSLICWWIVAYRSSGSFLYPLMRGTHRPEFLLFNQHNSILETLRFVGVFLFSYCYLPFFFPLFLLQPGRERRALFVLGATVCFAGIAIVSQMTFALYRDLYRYLTPMAFAFGLFSAGIVARQIVQSSRVPDGFWSTTRLRLAFLLAALAILSQVPGFWWRSIISTVHIKWAMDARHYLLTDPIGPVNTDAESRAYIEAFSRVPRGASTLIALDYPFLLDYRAHSIFNIDVAGAASPSPGLPYFRGAQPVKDYLLSKGIRYIAHVPLDHSVFLHSRKAQIDNLSAPYPAYRYYATFELDFYNNVDQLAKTNRVIYDSPFIRVIDLQGQ